MLVLLRNILNYRCYVLNCSARVIFSGACHHVTSATPRSSALAATKGTHLVQTLHTGVQGNPWPCTMLSEQDVHSCFYCFEPFCSPFRCSWLQLGNWAFTVAGPVAWNSLPLDKVDMRLAPTLSTFKNMLKTSHIFSHVPTLRTNCFQSTSSEHCTVPV